MTATEYKAIKTRLGASYSAISRLVGVSTRTAIRWATTGVCGPAAKILIKADKKGAKHD